MTMHDGSHSGEGGHTEETEPFAQRWSRRKRAAAQTDDSEALAAPVDEAAEANDPPALTDGDMPPVESLTEDDDVSAFFSEGVSESLRNKALRRLFHMPKFQLRDGLDDYDDDFRSFTPLGDIVTSDMRLQAERRLAREREAAANDESASPVAGADETADETGAQTTTERTEAGNDETLIARGPLNAGAADEGDTIGEADGD